jgi:hypothetical protein
MLLLRVKDLNLYTRATSSKKVDRIFGERERDCILSDGLSERTGVSHDIRVSGGKCRCSLLQTPLYVTTVYSCRCLEAREQQDSRLQTLLPICMSQPRYLAVWRIQLVGFVLFICIRNYTHWILFYEPDCGDTIKATASTRLPERHACFDETHHTSSVLTYSHNRTL